MKAVYIDQYGGSEKLLYRDLPGFSSSKLDPQSVLIQTIYAGVNFIDIYFREGIYPVPSFPFIMGKEGIGKILSVGEEVNDFKVGEEVLFFMGGTGSYAEEVVVESKHLVRVPTELDAKIVLGAGLQGMTAHYLVHDSYLVKPGDNVLIHAASGGVGLILTQLAKLKGARVIATVSNQEKKEKVLRLGVDEVIIYHDYRFEEEVLTLTEGRGVQVVYDSVGQATFQSSLRVLQARGTIVSYGQSSGKIPPFDIGQLSQLGSLSLTRPSLAHFILTRQEVDQRSEAVFSLIKENRLSIEVGGVYPISQACSAQDDLRNRKTTGKLILKI